VERRQLILLGIGIALAAGAIGLGAVRRAQVAAAERAAAEERERLDPLPPAEVEPPLADKPLQTERVGAFQVRVRPDGRAGVFGPDGELVHQVDAYQGAREVPDAQLFGAPVLEVSGKACEDPCNPRISLIALRAGRPFKVLEVAGVPRLEDLDRDGVPEVLVDHLMDGTREIITLPYRLEGAAFVAAYAKFPDGVDRQVEALSRSAERLCEQSATDECKDTLKALLGLEAFRAATHRADAVAHLHVESALRTWAAERDRVEAVAAEIARVLVE
jgi:hypothetical protein